MNQLRSRAAGTSILYTLYKILFGVSFHYVYRNSLNAVSLNIRIYLSKSLFSSENIVLIGKQEKNA